MLTRPQFYAIAYIISFFYTIGQPCGRRNFERVFLLFHFYTIGKLWVCRSQRIKFAYFMSRIRKLEKIETDPDDC